ncbi:MAG: radical SAM protein [Acidobacteriota bacterium]
MSDLAPVSSHALEPGVPVSADPAKAVPHVIAWNLTQRCNLACSHCYISAGSWHSAKGELSTAEVKRIGAEILELNPAPLFILSGGEPLVRNDLEEIAAFLHAGGATVVVGTNGIGLTTERIRSLQSAGVTGVAVSIDSLDATYHDRFRHGEGALEDTLAAIGRLQEEGLDFIVQTTLTKGNREELDELVAWSLEQGAVSFNLYFLVETGRGSGMSGLTPEENEAVLERLVELQQEHHGQMMVRSKCQPQIMRVAHQKSPESALLSAETRCPCGIHYCRITPEGKLTPCPYLPTECGDLRRESFADVWRESTLLQSLRRRELGGKCGSCEYRYTCGGCRARAQAESGDPLAAIESCLHEPAPDAVPITSAASVRLGESHELELCWTPEASERMKRIPSFVRGVVTGRVETHAKSLGLTEITVEFLDQVRRDLPVDFSKRLPFFLRRKKGD